MRRTLRPLALVLALLAALLTGTLTASAHPMGNFSINHYAALSIGRAAVRVLYVVDLAEIPTFQELGNLNADHSATLAPAQRGAYLASIARALTRGLSLRFDGRPLRLSLRADDLIFPPGAGGLPTERLYLVLQAPLPGAAGTLDYQDSNFADRAGWKEIVAMAASDATVSAPSTPSTSRSEALTVYPSDATSSPPQDLTATFAVAPVRQAARHAPDIAPAAMIQQAEGPLLGPGGTWSTLAQRLTVKGPAAGSVSWAQGRTDALTSLIARRDMPPAVLALSLLIAMALGALHAFSPGHGKTVVAAYIVGSRATARHAVLLGLTVTATHTVGVFALGLVTLWLARDVVPDQLYPWLGALSGLFIMAIGLSLAVRRIMALRRPVAHHAHSHDGMRGHAHHHNDAHAHAHAPIHAHGAHGPAHIHLPDGRTIGSPAALYHDHMHETSEYEEGQYATLGR